MRAASEAFQIFMLKAFDIREGEFKKAFLMQINIFLIICTLLIVKPTVNSLFLSRFGVESLPRVFLLVAITAALISTLYSRLLNKVSLNRIINSTIVFSIIFFGVFGILLRLNLGEGWVLYLFYIWVAIFAVLSASQFWILANHVFNVREAKRLFGFVGAGAITGGIFGGYLTSLLAPALGSENLLFVACGLLVFCIPITNTIWKKYVAGRLTKYAQQKRFEGFGDHPFKLIRRSKHLTFLASIIGVSVIVAKLVDYQFSDMALKNISDPDELTGFFGFWFSNFNVISLLVQLFITRRVVGVLGVGTSLFFLPVMIMAGAVMLLFFPALWAAIFLKMSDGSLKQSINKAAVELLALPIPQEIKNQTKTFIDVFVDSAATGIGGLILIFIVSGLNLSTGAINVMILVILCLWIYFAFKIRQEYLTSFRLKIRQNSGPEENKISDIRSSSVFGGLKKVLESGTESQKLYVLGKLRELNDNKLVSNIDVLLQDTSSDIRAEALRTLYFFKHKIPLDKLEKLTADDSQKVKIEAFEYLVSHFPEKRMEMMRKYLDEPNHRVRGAAMVSLAVESRDNPEWKNLFDLRERIRKSLEEIQKVTDPEVLRIRKISMLKTIGKGRMNSFFYFIEKCFHDEDPFIVNEAIAAAGDSMSPEFVNILTEFLSQPAYRKIAKAALINYGPGILPELTSLVNNGSTKIEIIRAVPGIFEGIPKQRSVDLLLSMLDYGDVEVRLEVLRSLNQLKINHPHLKFKEKEIIKRIVNESRMYMDTISALLVQIKVEQESEGNGSKVTNSISEGRKSLVDLLERRLDGSLERIFRLLGLKYPPEDVLSIYKGIQSRQKDMRVNALEYLDNLLEVNLKKILIPIVETSMLDTITEDAIQNLNLKIPSQKECFAQLLHGKDVRIKLAVLYLISCLKDKTYLTLIQENLDHPDQRVKDFAVKAFKAVAKTIK